MKQVRGYPYDMDLMIFKDKAHKAISLWEKMCDAFHDKAPELDEFQFDYLIIVVCAACLDSHRNGFSNGITGAELDETTIQKFIKELSKDELNKFTEDHIKWLKKFVVWLMTPTVEAVL